MFRRETYTDCEELRPTSEANKSPLENSLGHLVYMVHRILSSLSWETQERTSGCAGAPRGKEFAQIYRYCRQSLMACMWLGFSALRDYLKFNLKILQENFSKADLNIPVWLITILAGQIY